MLNKIRSVYIINEIFKNLRNKRKLNLIKYNKEIMNHLNITKEDFKAYEVLEQFNNKYNTDIEDIEIDELDLNKSNLSNEGLKYLRMVQ